MTAFETDLSERDFMRYDGLNGTEILAWSGAEAVEDPLFQAGEHLIVFFADQEIVVPLEHYLHKLPDGTWEVTPERPEPLATIAPDHLLVASGEGHFSVGACTGCSWELKGHRGDIERVYEDFHSQTPDNPVEMPPLVPLPAMTGDEFVDALERQIISILSSALVKPSEGRTVDDALLMLAMGIATARATYIQRGEPEWASWHGMGPHSYVALMTSKIRTLSPRRREKLRHPAITRRAQQDLLEGRR
jgi:hypothetical protein